MNGLSTPGALVVGLLAVPILVVYMLRTRRPRRVVASTFLWREATKSVAASRPWDRIRPTIPLLLQLLLLAVLVLALTRPFRSAPGVAGDHLVMVIDASGSMLATDVRPTRLDAAKTEAKHLIDTLSPGAVVSVVVAAGTPSVAVPATRDHGEAARAIDRIQASEAPADFADAFLMAESLELPGRPATIALVSDGGLTPEERALVPPGSVFRGVGISGDNVSVERVETGEAPAGFQALAVVRNYGDSDRRVPLAVLRDGIEVANATVTAPAGSPVERSFDLGPEPGRVEVRIPGGNALAADDHAFAVLEVNRPQHILLATPGNLFLESLLRSLAGAEVHVRAKATGGEGFDLVVYDRVAVPRRIAAPALFIAPTKLPGVAVDGIVNQPAITYIAPSDPLLAQVDLSELSIARAQRAVIPGARVLVGTSSSPLIAVWTEGTERRAWVGFDLHETNLPLQVAFPILFDHLLAWSSGAEPVSARFAGDVLELPPVAGADEVQIAIPGGRGATLVPGEQFVETQKAGFYDIEYYDNGDVTAERSVALSFPARESGLTPRDVEPRGGEERPGLTATVRSPAFAWVLALALAVLLVEWWWAHGRPTPARARSFVKRGKPA